MSTQHQLDFYEAEFELYKALNEFETMCQYAAISDEDFTKLLKEARVRIVEAANKSFIAKQLGQEKL